MIGQLFKNNADTSVYRNWDNTYFTIAWDKIYNDEIVFVVDIEKHISWSMSSDFTDKERSLVKMLTSGGIRFIPFIYFQDSFTQL